MEKSQAEERVVSDDGKMPWTTSGGHQHDIANL